MDFSAADLEDLRARGISCAWAKRQLELHRRGPAPVRLIRPCSVGDGILRLSVSEQAECEELGALALRQGRVLKFVPASGAASRMVETLLKEEPEALARWEAEKARLPFDDWRQASGLPKALLPFHRYLGGIRTALEEHLREAERLGIMELHFTVLPEHRGDFEKLLERLAPTCNVVLSEQSPSTDTLCLDQDGLPFRNSQGRLLFRPGGHGALLENLNALDADLILIKNIDNISHERLWDKQLRWNHILLGALLRRGRQSRPVRACGVIPNTGQPGGGPFWVEQGGREELQIVESAQVDLQNLVQKAIFKAATHFNPVHLACSVKGFDLMSFRDDSAVFVSLKHQQGRPLWALELPGLWNGGMAYWDTIFVEVPLETFHPVKTIFDLLQSSHQPE